MAKFPNLPRKDFGAPPSLETTTGILAAPELAPISPPQPNKQPKTRKKTGRTVLFSTRVSPAFDQEFRATAERDNLLLTRLLELSFAAYQKQRGGGKGTT
jgi:hypothetical protein